MLITNSSDYDFYFIKRDSIKEQGGYVYWLEMVDYDKPNNGFKSTTADKQGDCENNRSKTLSIKHFKIRLILQIPSEPFGNGEFELSPQTNPKWSYESPDSVGEILLEEVCEYVKPSPSITKGEIYTYEEGKAAVHKKDYQTAYSIFLPLAEQGNHDAQNYLSLLYQYGSGVSQDDKKAFYWKRKAVESGDEIWQYQVGNLYYQGKGTIQSFKDAANWFRKAAEKGHVSSQIALAYMYRDGKGVLKSSKEAFNWFMKAAIQGRAEAQYSIGYFYDTGEGIQKNPKQAFNWFMKAALQGNAKAQYYVGRNYYLGEGTPKSFKDAAYWVKKAYENKDDTSASSEAERIWNVLELWNYEEYVK
jgi:TPR repeat protein